MRMSKADDLQQRTIFLAAVCGQTYAQFENADGSFVVPSPYTRLETIEARSITNDWERFGFILDSDQEVIIAFRGTSTTTNWIADLIASQKKYKYIKEDCMTHRGFTDIYASARTRIISTLAKVSRGKTLFITGHSLGAALATLCAVDVAANTGFRSPYLFTFGSPRVGDPAFAKACASYVPNSFRIANLFDVVTHAPPAVYKLPKRSKTFYYSHVKNLSPRHFQLGSFGGNHVISSYFNELSKLQPEYTKMLSSANPGFCPFPERVL